MLLSLLLLLLLHSEPPALLLSRLLLLQLPLESLYMRLLAWRLTIVI